MNAVLPADSAIEDTSYHFKGWFWILAAVALLALTVIYFAGVSELVRMWNNREEYSHGFLIPVISLFLLWQKKEELARMAFRGAWQGVGLLLLGLVIYYLGTLSTLFILVQYSLVIVLAGLALSLTGWRGVRLWWVAVLFLVFMIPLPAFLYNNLSQKLQLISSELGVWLIRAFGISVYLEGNVIDLGNFKLQVVEACSGLRYLFPLMSFGFLCAYLFKAPFWQRAFVFFSTIPITVLMNSFRIGAIGILVDKWGTAQAEGFLHDFEGWVIFMACTAILFAEMWLFARLRRERKPLREVFGLEFPAPLPQDSKKRVRSMPAPFLVSVVLLALAAASAYGLDERTEVLPERLPLTEFPTRIGDWTGSTDRIEDIYLSALKLTDYYIGDFRNPVGDKVNFYAAYYQSQRSGESAHSPRSCIPGGGWLIKDLTQQRIDGVSSQAAPLVVNRLQIQKGDYKQLVYYWFQQRGRVITNEYLVKWYLFWDALTRNRSDGALVRLTTPVAPDEDWSQGDARLTGFARVLAGKLGRYIPD